MRIAAVAVARAHTEVATSELEAALANVARLGIPHPVMEDLRNAIIAGRRILAKSDELSRRLSAACEITSL